VELVLLARFEIFGRAVDLTGVFDLEVDFLFSSSLVYFFVPAIYNIINIKY